jgi:glycosyltransferase involved in cell wall biosynthesis
MSPAVSVVTAARNYGHFLADALRSVQRQTFSDWECVVVDDGSIDNTVAAVRPFLSDHRFRFIRSDSAGLARAKNLALNMSRASLLAPLDADDAWLPTKLERQVRLMRAEPKLGVVFARRFLMNEAGAILPTPRLHFTRGMILNDVLLDNFVCYSSTMLRREALERLGGFDNQLDLAVDYDLWLRIARLYPFDFIDEILVKYRTGHENLSTRLADRITIVLSTLRRTLERRGAAAEVPQEVQREAWGSICRTMAYIFRNDEPGRAAKWYCRAAWHDRRWRATFKALLRCFRNGIARRFAGSGGKESSSPNSASNL